MNLKRKIKLGLVIAGATTMGMSTAMAAKSSSDVSYLKYHTSESVFFGSATLSSPIKHSAKSQNTFQGANADTGEVKTKYINFAVEAKYGLSDEFNLGLDWDYMIRHNAESYAVGGATSEKVLSKGLNDPTIAAEWRYKNDADMTGDLNIDLTPGLMTRQDATTTDEGNYPDLNGGGHQLTLGTDLVMQKDDCEFSLVPWVSFVTSGKGKSKSVFLNASGATVETEYDMGSSFRYGLGLNYRHHFTNFYAGAAVNVTGPFKYDVTGLTATTTIGSTTTTLTSNSELEYKTKLTLNPQIVVGYSFASDLALDGTIEMDSHKQVITTTNKTSKAVTGITETKHKNFTFSLALHKQF